MSNGPIAAWWKSHLPPKVSTPDAHRVCAASAEPKRGLCGRRSAPIVDVTKKGEGRKVTCSDCVAAARADAAVRR